MITKHQPIKILGGGLAGLTTAIVLKRCNYDPIIYEKESACGFSRDKDIEGFESWNFCNDPLNFLTKIGIQPSFKYKPINFFNVHFDSFETISIANKTPLFHLVKRGINQKDIDRELQNQALSAGVEIRFGFRPEKKTMNIISAGAQKANAYIRGLTFSIDSDDQTHLFLNTSITNTGYGYLIIWNNHATLATAFRKKDSNNKKQLEKLKSIAESIIGKIPKDANEFASYGSFDINQTRIDKDKRMYIGEAGGFQDFLFGLGMNHAIHSGYFAAMSIIKNIPFDKLYNQHLLPHMKASYVNRFFYEKLNEFQRYKICLKIKKTQNPLQFLKNHSQFTFKKKMIYNLFGRKFNRR